MQHFDTQQLASLTGTALPLSILLIESDADRQFLTDLYLQYRPLMYRIATPFFRGNEAEVEDAVSGAVERLCKKCDTLRQVPCNKQASYIVITVRNVCLSRLRQLGVQWRHRIDTADPETIENIPGQDDVQGIVFERVFAGDLLDAFPQLSERDRHLIRLRHVDRLGYAEICQQMGISQTAARTAVSRAKSKLERLATNQKRDDNNG